MKKLVLLLALFVIFVLPSCEESDSIEPQVSKELPQEKYKDDESDPPVNGPD